MEFNIQGYLRHLKEYRWEEADWKDIRDAKYDKLVPTAHGILIGNIGPEIP